MFAIAVDLIVIIMAFAGSRSVDEVDQLFIRVQKDSFRRTRNVQLDDPYELSKSLDKNLERLQIASRYGLALDKAVRDFEHQKKVIHLRRGGEEAPSEAPTTYAADDLLARADKWTPVRNRVERLAAKSNLVIR